MVDNLFFSRCCNSSTTSLRYSSSWIRRFARSRVGRARSIDNARPPYRQAADGQKDRQERQSGQSVDASLKLSVTPSAPPSQRGHDSDPEAAERGGKEHGRKIRREEHIGPDQRKTPPRQGRQCEAEAANPMLKSGDGWDDSLASPPKLVDQIFHASHQPISESKIRAGADSEEIPIFAKRSRSNKRITPGSDCEHQNTQSEVPAMACVVSVPRGYTETSSAKTRRTTWDGWTARSR